MMDYQLWISSRKMIQLIYGNKGLAQFVVASVLVLGPACGHIFDNAQVTVGEETTLTCNLKNIPHNIPSANISEVFELEVSQIVAPGSVPLRRLLRTYKAGWQRPMFHPWITNSSGRVTAVSDGFSGIDNTGTAKVSFKINQAECDDAALYMCFTKLVVPSGYAELNVTQTLGVAVRTEISGAIVPDKELYSDDTETVVHVSCNAVGPRRVQILWNYQLCAANQTTDSVMENLEHWSPGAVVLAGTLGNTAMSGCQQVITWSKLANVSLTNGTHDVCLIQCVAQDSQGIFGHVDEFTSWNKTINYGEPKFASKFWLIGVAGGVVVALSGVAAAAGRGK